MLFDNLEYLTIENQKIDFPQHYHETFCISLISRGIEQINFDGQSFFSEEGNISITNPYEIHSNPIADNNIQLDFNTIYISKDLMKYLFNGKNITFVNRKIENIEAKHRFIILKNAIDTRNSKNIELRLHQFVNILQHYTQENEKEYLEPNINSFNQVGDFIENNICDKFCLNELSKVANINKFGFLKKFKTSTGMTPMHYILMKKIFSSKKLITSQSELTEIAYQYNFTDMAHFSKTFKRYVGLSPKMYQESIRDLL